MTWKAWTLRPSPTSHVTGSTPVVVKNGMHQPGYPLVHCSERLGCAIECEDMCAQLREREFSQQLDGLQAAPRPRPGPRQPGWHGGNLSAADDQAPPVERAAER